MSLTLQQLAQHLDGQIRGDALLQLNDVASLEFATPGDLSFIDSRKKFPMLRASRAGAVLITEELAQTLPESEQRHPLLLVADPQAAFISAMLLFRPVPERSNVGISDKALISPSAEIGADCNVFPGAQIGENVQIGPRCDIGPNVVIGAGVTIGEECVLHANTVIYPGMVLKNRIIVHANAVIGADGFGYRFEDGQLRKIPHTGTVIIEDDVEVGACATIDKAMVGATLIGQGTKLDNQVQIAHNCRIGKHNALASQVGLAGSVVTGDYVQCGGQVGIADHCTIAPGTKFGGKAGVMADVSEQGIYYGIPAIPEKIAIKNHLNLKKISLMRDQIKELTQTVADLQKQLAALDADLPLKSVA